MTVTPLDEGGPFWTPIDTFRQNIVVEINQPRVGIDTNLQSVFATDADGKRWVLHQGRMSVTGTSQVIAQDEWTPDVVEARQQQLLEVLYEKWAIEGG